MLKTATLHAAELLNILPDEDISIVTTIIKKLILAWDPDYTKLTAAERESLERSESEIKNGEYISEEDFWE